MVLATLFNRSPFSGKALLSEIVTCSGLAPRDYFSHYCQRLLKGQMSLYLKYGIALEAHQQNTLMVFKNNLAIKHLNRDLGGVRIYKPLLQRAGYLLNLKENSLIESEDITEVRNKFIHATLQSHLSFVVNCLCKDFSSVNKNELWRIVFNTMDAIFHLLKPDLDEQYYQQERKALFKGPWLQKCLLRMRLEPCSGEYLYHQIDNPLTSFS